MRLRCPVDGHAQRLPRYHDRSLRAVRRLRRGARGWRKTIFIPEDLEEASDHSYAEAIHAALVTEWRWGMGDKELRVMDPVLWDPAWDAVEAANFDAMNDWFPEPVWDS